MVGKAQVVDRIVARGASRAAATAAVDAVLEEVTALLAAGERVTLTGFGTFEAVPRAARSARNPRTGASIDVPATTTARFHPGAGLRAAVAQGTADAPRAVPTGLRVGAPVAAEVKVAGADEDVVASSGKHKKDRRADEAKKARAKGALTAPGSEKVKVTTAHAGKGEALEPKHKGKHDAAGKSKGRAKGEVDATKPKAKAKAKAKAETAKPKGKGKGKGAKKK